MFLKTVLDNGVRIISESIDHLPSVSLGIWVNAGSCDETIQENGISHFIEHMIFKGTGNRTGLQIAKELDAIGGLSNAFTGKENTCFHARVLGRHFTRLSDILSDIFLNSLFDFEDMERERQVIFQEIGMVEDTPDENIHVLFHRHFWADQPIGMSILGSEESVAGIGREEILRYMNTRYKPERVVVAAAGHVDHEAMVSYFRPLFEPLQRGNSTVQRPLPVCKPGVNVLSKDLEQVHICLGGEAPSQLSKKRYACAILNTVLGGNMSSRLFQEIREKQGLAYSVYSFVSSYMNTGLLGVYLGTDKESVNVALDTIQAEVKKICKGGLSQSDLAEAKDHLIGGIYLASESADNRMMRIARNELIYERFVGHEELIAELERVTVDEVVEICSDVFLGNGVCLVILGPMTEDGLDKRSVQFG